MTIAELIEQLGQLNPAMIVKVPGPNWDDENDCEVFVAAIKLQIIGCTEVQLS